MHDLRSAAPRLRYPAIRPEMPAPEAWLPFLSPAYDANWFTNFGAVSRRLEATLARLWGFADTRCVVASSGTAALAAPLIARRIEGRVLLPAFTFPATLSAVRMAGATPRLIDVSAEDWRVSPAQLDAGLKAHDAAAAILVCPFGLASDFSEHIAVARAHGALLVIDNAAGLGVTRRNVEAAGDVFEIYSLHATKPFGIGEGGAIFAHRDEEAALRSALNFGLPDLGEGGGPRWGINGKMAEAQAAIGLAVAQTFPARLAARRAMAARYAAALSDFADIAFATAESAWQVFPLLLPDARSAERFVEAAAAHGMEVRRYYRPALSTQAGVSCPNSESLAARMCCLPVYSSCDEGETEAMISIVRAALAEAIECVS